MARAIRGLWGNIRIMGQYGIIFEGWIEGLPNVLQTELLFGFSLLPVAVFFLFVRASLVLRQE